MRILVTGAGGQTGKAVIKALEMKVLTANPLTNRDFSCII